MQIRDSEREKKKTLLTRDQKDLKFELSTSQESLS